MAPRLNTPTPSEASDDSTNRSIRFDWSMLDSLQPTSMLDDNVSRTTSIHDSDSTNTEDIVFVANTNEDDTRTDKEDDEEVESIVTSSFNDDSLATNFHCPSFGQKNSFTASIITLEEEVSNAVVIEKIDLISQKDEQPSTNTDTSNQSNVVIESFASRSNSLNCNRALSSSLQGDTKTDSIYVGQSYWKRIILHITIACILSIFFKCICKKSVYLDSFDSNISVHFEEYDDYSGFGKSLDISFDHENEMIDKHGHATSDSSAKREDYRNARTCTRKPTRKRMAPSIQENAKDAVFNTSRIVGDQGIPESAKPRSQKAKPSRYVLEKPNVENPCRQEGTAAMQKGTFVHFRTCLHFIPSQEKPFKSCYTKCLFLFFPSSLL
jgi:hypothetical protein